MKGTLVIAALVVIVVVGLLAYSMRKPKEQMPTPRPLAQESTQPVTTPKAVSPSIATAEASVSEAKKASYTLAEVAMHAKATDCWMAIDGKVYNVSEFVTRHPGGKAIVNGCGKDASAMFAAIAKHEAKARSFLPNFEIGTLAP